MSIGQIAGAVLFQFFGQLAARGAFLAPRGISMPTNVVIALYERLIAFSVSLGLAVAGGWFLFGRVFLDTKQGGDHLLKIFGGMVIAVLAGAIVAWGRSALEAVRPFASRRTALVVARNIALTLGVQLSTSAAYVLAVKSFVPAVDTLDAIAASAVVMFAASLPISLAGWGVRELSAVLALSFIGVPSVAALAVSLVVGAVSLLVVVVLAAAAVMVLSDMRAPSAASVPQSESTIDIEAMAHRVFPLAAATALFFQLQIPSGSGRISVNLADPIAILTGLMFVLMYFGASRPRWRLSGLDTCVVAATVVVFASFVHGYWNFGWSDWAFTSKLLGWFVLLSYGATGAIIVCAAGREGLRMLLSTFVAVAAALVVFETVLLACQRLGLDIPAHISQLPMAGFSQNRNAFGFLLLLAVCSLPFLPVDWRKWFLSALLVGVWFTGSRSIAGATVIVLCAMIAIRSLSLRSVIGAASVAVAVTLVMSALPWLGGAPDSQSVWQLAGLSDSSTAQRVQSLLGGIDLFVNNPVFGAGLGAYMEAQIKLGDPLVIHSTPVWLLGEMGVVGAAVLMWPLARILSVEWRNLSDEVGAFLLMIVLAFAIVCQVHEIMYQRAFWLLLGAGLACLPIGAGSVPQVARASR